MSSVPNNTSSSSLDETILQPEKINREVVLDSIRSCIKDKKNISINLEFSGGGLTPQLLGIDPYLPIGETSLASSLQNSLLEASASGDYVQAKRALSDLSDLRRGIISTYIEPTIENGFKMPVYMRDARRIKQDKKNEVYQIGFENWAIAGLTHIQAAERMVAIQIDLEPNMLSGEKELLKEKWKNHFSGMAAIFIKQMLQIGNMNVDSKATEAAAKSLAYNTINYVIAPVLAKVLRENPRDKNSAHISVKTAVKRMEQLKDFTNMDEKPYALVTLLPGNVIKSNNKDGYLGADQIDIPIYQLTEEQKKDYLDILNLETNSANLPKWYSSQKPYAQEMIKSYAKAILEGRVLPTQTLKYLSGLRNAYQSVVDAHIIKDAQEVTESSEMFRHGNLAHITQKQRKSKVDVELTRQAMEQFAENTGKSSLLIQSTVSPLPGLGEGRLNACTQAAAKSFNEKNNQRGWKALYANTPLNWFRQLYLWNQRGVERNIASDAEKMVRSACDGLDDKTWNALINTALAGKPNNVPSLDNYLKIKENPEVSKTINTLFQEMVAYKRILGGVLPRPDNQDNVQRMTHVSTMNDLMNQYGKFLDKNSEIAGEQKRTRPDTAYSICCKSGKDRTGLALFSWAANNISRVIFGNSQPLFTRSTKGEDVDATNHLMRTMALAGHGQKLAGGLGGSMGAEGFKNNWFTSDMIPKPLKDVASFLVKKTASANKGIKGKHNAKEKEQTQQGYKELIDFKASADANSGTGIFRMLSTANGKQVTGAQTYAPLRDNDEFSYAQTVEDSEDICPEEDRDTLSNQRELPAAVKIFDPNLDRAGEIGPVERGSVPGQSSGF